MDRMNIIVLAMAFCVWAVNPSAVQAACNASITATAPDSRYTDNGDSTVMDKVTGLMWKQCSEGLSTTTVACDTGSVATYTWKGALQQAEILNNGGGFAGYTDWRLPNRNELASLVERQCYGPAINTNLFPNTVSSKYWSSSPYANSSRYAWYVFFYNGYVGNVRNVFMPDVYNARLVRGGQ